MVQISQWERLWWALWLIIGIGAVVHGLTAEQFTFFWSGGVGEREQYKPEWYHRLLEMLIGSFMSALAVCHLFALHCPFLKYVRRF